MESRWEPNEPNLLFEIELFIGIRLESDWESDSESNISLLDSLFVSTAQLESHRNPIGFNCILTIGYFSKVQQRKCNIEFQER